MKRSVLVLLLALCLSWAGSAEAVDADSEPAPSSAIEAISGPVSLSAAELQSRQAIDDGDDDEDDDEDDEDDDEDEGEDWWENDDDDEGEEDDDEGEAQKVAEEKEAEPAKAPEQRPTPPAGGSVPSILLSPRLGPMPPFPQVGEAVALNDEMVAGLTVGFWPTKRAGLEINFSVFPLGGEANTKQLAVAVLRLLDTSFRLESVDRDFSLSVSFAAAPFSGPISFFGAPSLYAEFLLAVGGGVEKNSLEMLSYFGDGTNESAQLAQAAQAFVRPIVNLSIGSRIFLHPRVGLRIDFRAQGGFGMVLNYDEAQAAATNRNLGALANRLTCSDSSIPTNERACRTALEFSAGVELGLEFAVAGPKQEALDRVDWSPR